MSDSEPAQDDTDATASANDVEPGLFPGAMTDGWPSPPPAAETDAGGADEPAVAAQAAPADPDDMAEVADTSNTWAAGTVDSWPMRPAVADASPSEPESQSDENVETPSDDTLDAVTGDPTRSTEAVARAMRLLEELQQTISEIDLQAHGAADLSGVISDLQVAVNPPGAMAADDVAELRDALLAARERPRDIDMIVDLTKRIDAMLALVIAYDRAIAAIERSLEALRG